MKRTLNTLTLLTGTFALWLFATGTSQGATTRFDQRSGSKLRMEGTSTLHDWQVECPLIIGHLEVGPDFPTQPGQAAKPGKVEAHGEASVKVHSLFSVHKDGKRYSDDMDNKMRNMLEETNYPSIVFTLKELTLKETAKDKDSPYLFEGNGDLAVHGKTNNITMPIAVLPLGEKNGYQTLKITGTAPLKMTQFGMEPAGILIKTADEVTIKFEWMVGHKNAAAASATK
jgi:hypothetical protein